MYPGADSPMTLTDDRLADLLASDDAFVDEFCQVSGQSQARERVHCDVVAFTLSDEGFFMREDITLQQLNFTRPFVCLMSGDLNAFQMVREAQGGRYIANYETKIYFEMAVESDDVTHKTLKTYDSNIDTSKPHEVLRAWKNLVPKILWGFNKIGEMDITRIRLADLFRADEKEREAEGDFVGAYAVVHIGPEG